MINRIFIIAVIVAVGGWSAALPAHAQTAGAAARPTARVSFYTNFARTQVDGLPVTNFGELRTSVTYQLPDDLEDNGVEYGLDARESSYVGRAHPRRVSIYEGFVGFRLADGAARARFGHLWLNDLGAHGSIAGAAFEYRQSRNGDPSAGRVRAGAFAGFEPNIHDTGYAAGVRKLGGYLAFDGAGARRHVAGFVTIRDGSLTERSVVTATNFLPIGQRLFLYQAADYDLQAPAGRGRRGLSYFYSNARISPISRLDLQSIYSRGRSVDARGIAQDIASGRPVTQASIDGLLYESIGGRATVEVVPRVRVYAGYSRDKTNRDESATGRLIVGGFASNAFGSGLDLAGSDSSHNRPDRTYHARHFSVGRQIGRSVYVSGDWSTSLSVIRFSRTDGLLIEQRPETARVGGTATLMLPHATSVLVTVDRTADQGSHELRVLTGITYRFR